MQARNLPFSLSEYQERLEKVRRSMESQALELLILSDPSNMAWLTGYDGWSFYVHQCVVVTLTDEPLWYGRKMDAQGALRTTWLEEENITYHTDESWRSEANEFFSAIEANEGIKTGNSADALRLMKIIDKIYSFRKG